MFGGVYITLEDLFDAKNGYTPSKANSSFWTNGNIPWFRIDDINDGGKILYKSKQYVSKEAIKKNGLFKKDSIIISTSATIGEYALIRVPFLCNQRFTCLMLKDEFKDLVDMKYILHYCIKLSFYCKEHLNKGNFASVEMTSFNKFLFYLPTLERQKEIISILDKFDSYCNDITKGLPAEIEARNKQYEYYRNKLLTFKRLEK